MWGLGGHCSSFYKFNEEFSKFLYNLDPEGMPKDERINKQTLIPNKRSRVEL